MGMGRFIHSKVRNEENIIQDLKSAGIAPEEVNRHEFLMKTWENQAEKLSDVNKELIKAEDKSEKIDSELKKYKEQLDKLRSKCTPKILAPVMYSRIFFTSKNGKKYRNIKKKIERKKAIKEVIEEQVKMLEAKKKEENKENNKIKKDVKNKKSELIKIWKKSKYEMKTIEVLKHSIEIKNNVYDKSQMKNIIKMIQEEKMPEDVSVKDLCKEIETATKKKQKPKDSIMDKISPIVSQQSTQTQSTQQQNAQTQSTQAQSTQTSMRNNLKNGNIYVNSSIRRENMEEVVRKLQAANISTNRKSYMQSITADNILSWIGCMSEMQENNGKINATKAIKIIESNQNKPEFAEKGMQIMEKQIATGKIRNNKQNKKMDRFEKLVYEMAKSYNEIEKERIKKLNQKGQNQNAQTRVS